MEEWEAKLTLIHNTTMHQINLIGSYGINLQSITGTDQVMTTLWGEEVHLYQGEGKEPFILEGVTIAIVGKSQEGKLTDNQRAHIDSFSD